MLNGVAAQGSGAEQAARLIRQPDDRYVYTYSHQHPSIATVEAGETVKLVTLDAFANKVTSDDHKVTDKCPPPYNLDPLTGPLWIEGAERGDALRVKIHDIEPDRDFAVTALIANFGGLTRTDATPMMHPPLEEISKVLPIRDGFVNFDDIKLPFRPFVGCIGVAPFLEAIKSLTPDTFGGNMDCMETVPGNTLILPVEHEGAHFFIGDAHAAQGEGEVSGVAAEMAARITVSFEIDKGAAPNWPRIESETHLMVAASRRPLEDAARCAWMELIQWLQYDYGVDPTEAYMLMGVAGEMRLGNMVDPNYTMVAKINRQYIPKKQA